MKTNKVREEFKKSEQEFNGRRTLEDCINNVLVEVGEKYKLPKEYDEVGNFVTDDKKSADFIRLILNDDFISNIDEKNTLYEITQTRARHSALTFLIGLVFKKFGGLFDAFSKTRNLPYNEDLNFKLWLITALNHDRGFYSTYINDDSEAYKRLYKLNLFTDTYENQLSYLNSFSVNYPNVLAYSYDEIAQYDLWAINYHKGWEKKEKRDHGILGAQILFNESINKAKKYKTLPEEILDIKACSLTIAQHNMYKTSNKDDDKKFPYKPKKLQYGSNFRISSKTPMLLFLSLIDTFECVKKFGRKENEKCNIQVPTILKDIELSVSFEKIIIDYTKLTNYLLERDKSNDSKTVKSPLIKSKEKYFNDMDTLCKWTNLISNFDYKNNICTIKNDKEEILLMNG